MKLTNFKIKKYVFVFQAMVLFFIISACNDYKIVAKNRFCDIYIINTENKKIKLKVEIAETPESMQTGLMHRKHLDENSGMLFIFENEKILSFWMKNTYIPLDIAYINQKCIINEIYYMKPLDSTIYYRSRMKAIFALEVNRDWFKNNNITPGCWILFNGCLGKQNKALVK